MKNFILAILPLLAFSANSPIPSLSGKTFVISFSQNGSISAIKKGKTGKDILPLRGNLPLWEISFSDGSTLASNNIPISQIAWEKRRDGIAINYKSELADVLAMFSSGTDGVELSFILHPKSKTILSLRSPILNFPPEAIEKIYVPEGLGLAFTRNFFTADMGLTPQPIGDEGLRSVVGEGCVMRPVADEPVPIELTEMGRRWLGEDVGKKLVGHRMVVNRPPEGKVEVVKLVDSPNGALLAGYKIGKGWLFRFGGWVKREDGEIVFLLFQRTVQHLWEEKENRIIAILDIAGGPKGGAFNELLVPFWEDRLPSLLPSFQLKKISTIKEFRNALKNPSEYPLIINPYGEYIPTGERGAWRDVLGDLRNYLEMGGIWWELGGFPFYYELVPRIGGVWHTEYPPAFCDFLYVQSQRGSIALYGVQNSEIFVPVSMQVGREGDYGYLWREWRTYVDVGKRWRSPSVRIVVGVPLLEALGSYAKANGLTRKLRDKLSPSLFEKLSQSVLVKYEGGTFKEQIEKAGKLPRPSLVHFADYLHGGFDKQYPDHLPPNPRKGTPEEFRQLYDELHKLGHLVMPYTNPTWWCDDPKGPTFIKEGEAPLARDLKGEKIKEVYGANWGWAICPWHPAVREAERKIREQFTKYYPSDILFQDQIGARSWIYDTNPASPTPYAYTQGWINIIKETSRYVPLATEGGWDGVMNWETLFCGVTWFLLPSEWRPAWATLYREQYPPEAWHFYPLAIFLAHDKVGFYHHDLGQFVTNNETLTWTLLLGYGLSYTIWPSGLDEEGRFNWLQWLSLLQRKVVSLYFGEKPKEFQIIRPAKDRRGCGVMRVDYPKVSIIANTDPEPYALSEKMVIAPYGFYVKGKGVEAGMMVRWEGKDYPDGISLLKDGGDLWIYQNGALRKSRVGE
ncbi:hypothetical protein H5T87_04290 [bacterium]|nr:hypothetical protein [bacterium]